MSSASSPVKDTLQAYLAGRVRAERVVEVVASAYYGEGGKGRQERWRRLMEVIERAHPGVIELAGTADKPGFAVRLAERPFPGEYEGELRKAVEAVLAGHTDHTVPDSPVPSRGLVVRFFRAVRRLFTAST